MTKAKKAVMAKRGDALAVVKQTERRQNRMTNLDGWNNFFTGVGIQGSDRRTGTSFSANQLLPENILRNLYRGDGLAKRIIELPVQAMMNRGFKIVGDPEGMVVARMEETGIMVGLEEMARWSRVFGGTLGILGIDDGQKLDMPVNEANIRNIHYIHVYNRWRVQIMMSDMYKDTRNPKFGKPEFYRVSPLYGVPFKVHESRTIRMDGAPVDDLTLWQNQGWGDSYLQACFEELRQLSGVYTSVESIVEDFVTQTLGIKGLADLMKNGKEAVAIKRLDFLDKSRHTINTNLIDADLETFTKVASSLAGMPDALDRFMNKLSSVTGIPVTLLMGMAPAGLNATGDADQDNWYDTVSGWQKKDLRPAVERYTKLIMLANDYYFEGVQPEAWKLEFNKLKQPSEKEQADLEKVEIDTINSLIDHNVMTEDEARDVPFIREKYGLVGPAPVADDPVDMGAGGAGDVLDVNGNPVPQKAIPPADNAAPKEGRTDAHPIYKLPADPAAARAGIMTICRAQVMDSRGRRRGDAAQFEPRVIVIPRSMIPDSKTAGAYVAAHGFDSGKMIMTQTTFRFIQGDAATFVAGTDKPFTLEHGVEVVLGRLTK